MINIVGNIVMFVPWGCGLVCLWEKNRNIPRILMWSAVLPLFIETWQLFVGRSVDIDDWILNFIGGIVGGLAYLVWSANNPFPTLEALKRCYIEYGGNEYVLWRDYGEAYIKACKKYKVTKELQEQWLKEKSE